MNYILKLLSVALCLSFCSCRNAVETYIPQNGDILFQDIDCGPLCDAIELVTVSYGNYHFSHLGLIYKKSDDSIFVIEAIGNAVQLTSYKDFIARTVTDENKPKVIAMRSRFSATQMDSVVTIALQEIGKPYDDYFLPDNDRWYCSELIAYAFNSALKQTVFESSPMTYKELGSDNIMPIWKDYFQKLNASVPEGIAGCNPGAMSRSDNLKLVYAFY
jgi:predicted nuclease of predicted toxin-antitoxin system